jgi:hypothetical protein
VEAIKYFRLSAQTSKIEDATYFKLSADRSHSGGQAQYGMCLAIGFGVARNYREALKYFQLSANQKMWLVLSSSACAASVGKELWLIWQRPADWHRCLLIRPSPASFQTFASRFTQSDSLIRRH